VSSVDPDPDATPEVDACAGLDEAQARAVTAPESLLAIIAGAGSGKTTVLTRRIAHRIASGAADGRHTMAITFTRQAARELRVRLRALGARDGVTAGTFHAVAYGLLRLRWSDLNRRPPVLVTHRQRLIEELLPGSPRGRPGGRGATAAISPSDVLAEIDWARARMITPDGYAGAAEAARRRAPIPFEAVAEVFAGYEQLKRTRGVIDFDDLPARLVSELERSPDFAAATQWRFRHLFVDEFQDVNPLQHALLEALRGGRPDLTIVGDPQQAIYGWNGADPRLLEEVERTYPGVRVIRLDRNYRCTPTIVAAGGRALAVDGIAPTAVATRPDGPPVRVVAADDELDEARRIAAEVRQLRRPGGRWSALAVLARTNAQLPAIARALEDVAVPHRITATERANRRSDDPLIAQLLSDAAALRSANELSAWAIDLASGEPDADGDVVAPPAQHVQLASSVRAYLAEMSAGGNERARVDGRGFAEWRQVAEAGDQHMGDAVELVTFHAAKGREWRCVVLSGMEEGLVPHFAARTATARREEIRLAYVAATRAADELVLTWAAERDGRACEASELVEALTGGDAAPAEGEPHVESNELALFDDPRPSSRRTADAERERDPLAVALGEWRQRAAAASGLPPQAVCTDEALAAVAALRPTSIEELAEIDGIGPMAARRLGPRLLAVIGTVHAGEGAHDRTATHP
jgi:DNA helicase-2/ATP-dependent DNA helicase PcrA